MTPTAATPPTDSSQIPTPAKPRLHLDFLDGVRGLAALYVVLHHLYLGRFRMQAQTHFPDSLGNVFLYGHLAVGVFLVVSGFCLALPVTEKRQLVGGAIPFFGKRARRILPPYYAAIVMSIGVAWFRHHFAHAGSFTQQDLVLNALLLQDVVPSANNLDLPLWSVAVEWKIYFLFPLFLWVWHRWGSLALLASGLVSGALATALWVGITGSREWGHTCPWFLALFAMGIAAAGIARSETPVANRWRSRMPLVASLGMLVLLALLWMFPVTERGEFARFVPALPAIDLTTGLVSAALFIIVAHQKRESSAWKRLLEWRPLMWLGSFAYSLYLTHEPLIRVLKFVFSKLLGARSSQLLGSLIYMVGGLAILVVAAFVFFLLFERPFLTRRARAALTLNP